MTAGVTAGRAGRGWQGAPILLGTAGHRARSPAPRCREQLRPPSKRCSQAPPPKGNLPTAHGASWKQRLVPGAGSTKEAPAPAPLRWVLGLLRALLPSLSTGTAGPTQRRAQKTCQGEGVDSSTRSPRIFALHQSTSLGSAPVRLPEPPAGAKRCRDSTAKIKVPWC